MAKIDSLFSILQPSQPHPQTLAGLARTAAEAPLDSIGCLTEYRPLTSRSIVNKVTSNRHLPFSHAINPYRGCEFACRYCYARYTHEFMEMTPADFERKIYFKQNAAWLLEQELKRLKPGTEIAIGTATDPYQPLERKLKITRSLLEVFARHSGFRIGIISKSALIARDIDLLKEIAKTNKLTVHTTVTTMNAKLARQLEPRAPRPDLRMRTVSEMRAAGLRAGVMCSPLMPGITDSASSIRAVARAAAAAGASFLASGALFLKPCSLPTFLAIRWRAFSRATRSLQTPLRVERVCLHRVPRANERARRPNLLRIQAGQAVYLRGRGNGVNPTRRRVAALASVRGRALRASWPQRRFSLCAVILRSPQRPKDLRLLFGMSAVSPGVEDEPHHQVEHDQIGRDDAEPIPFFLRPGPPDPGRNKSRQGIWRNDKGLQPSRPLGKWSNRAVILARSNRGHCGIASYRVMITSDTESLAKNCLWPLHPEKSRSMLRFVKQR